ncbi:MAG: hypothetical protein LBN10_05210 [Propionibacteriaceae bacterium]|jgi:hypothetical protein|nr:hypothetical protein [Propionibacteriaceae bacterium]
MKTNDFEAAVDRAILANDALDVAISEGYFELTWSNLLMFIDELYVDVANKPTTTGWMRLAGMCLEAARVSTPAPIPVPVVEDPS